MRQRSQQDSLAHRVLHDAGTGKQVINFIAVDVAEQVEDPAAELRRLGARQPAAKRDDLAEMI